jgi:hypothetical protein
MPKAIILKGIGWKHVETGMRKFRELAKDAFGVYRVETKEGYFIGPRFSAYLRRRYGRQVHEMQKAS